MSHHRSFGRMLAWAYAMDGGRQVITSVMMLVLAVILGPEAYGLIAMALVYILFLELLLKQGMAAAVVQRQDLRGVHLDSAFWMVMAMSVVLSIASVSLSGWWATVNRTPELRPIIVALSTTVPLQGLVVVQEAILRRNFRFRSLALRSNLSALLGGALGISLALAGFGVWSLVAQQIGTALIAVVVLWAVSDWRPRLRFSTTAARQLLGFSTGSLLGSLGAFVNNKVDALLIGLLFGPLAVGLYRLTTRVVELVIGVTIRALMSVSLPELSREQTDPERFKQSLLRLLSVSAILSIPALGVLVGSSDAVLGAIGRDWAPAAGALRLLAAAGAAHALFVIVSPMLQALGRPYAQAVFAWASGLLSGCGFLVAGLLVRDSPLGVQLNGLALSRFLLYGLLLSTAGVIVLRKVAGVRLSELATVVGPALAAAAAAAASGNAAWTLLGLRDLSTIPALLLTSGGAGATALAVLTAADVRFRQFVVATCHRARSMSRSFWREGRVTGSNPTDGLGAESSSADGAVERAAGDGDRDGRARRRVGTPRYRGTRFASKMTAERTSLVTGTEAHPYASVSSGHGSITCDSAPSSDSGPGC